MTIELYRYTYFTDGPVGNRYAFQVAVHADSPENAQKYCSLILDYYAAAQNDSSLTDTIMQLKRKGHENIQCFSPELQKANHPTYCPKNSDEVCLVIGHGVSFENNSSNGNVLTVKSYISALKHQLDVPAKPNPAAFFQQAQVEVNDASQPTSNPSPSNF